MPSLHPFSASLQSTLDERTIVLRGALFPRCVEFVVRALPEKSMALFAQLLRREEPCHWWYFFALVDEPDVFFMKALDIRDVATAMQWYTICVNDGLANTVLLKRRLLQMTLDESDFGAAGDMVRYLSTFDLEDQRISVFNFNFCFGFPLLVVQGRFK